MNGASTATGLPALASTEHIATRTAPSHCTRAMAVGGDKEVGASKIETVDDQNPKLKMSVVQVMLMIVLI